MVKIRKDNPKAFAFPQIAFGFPMIIQPFTLRNTRDALCASPKPVLSLRPSRRPGRTNQANARPVEQYRCKKCGSFQHTGWALNTEPALRKLAPSKGDPHGLLHVSSLRHTQVLDGYAHFLVKGMDKVKAAIAAEWTLSEVEQGEQIDLPMEAGDWSRANEIRAEIFLKRKPSLYVSRSTSTVGGKSGKWLFSAYAMDLEYRHHIS